MRDLFWDLQGRFNFHLLGNLYSEERFSLTGNGTELPARETFGDAKAACVAENKILALPQNPFDTFAMMEMAADVINGNSWDRLWINVKFSNDAWRNDAGLPVPARDINWNVTAPDGTNPCVFMTSADSTNGTWNDADCDDSYGYFCEPGSYLQYSYIPIYRNTGRGKTGSNLLAYETTLN